MIKGQYLFIKKEMQIKIKDSIRLKNNTDIWFSTYKTLGNIIKANAFAFPLKAKNANEFLPQILNRRKWLIWKKTQTVKIPINANRIKHNGLS